MYRLDIDQDKDHPKSDLSPKTIYPTNIINIDHPKSVRFPKTTFLSNTCPYIVCQIQVPFHEKMYRLDIDQDKVRPKRVQPQRTIYPPNNAQYNGQKMLDRE
jgi:hypothetical protein